MKTKLNKEKIIKSKKILLTLIPLIITYLYLNKKFSFFIPCIFHKTTHLYCPGCGITRMILSIIKMDFYQAFRYNPLMFILSPFFLIYGITYYINWLKDKNFEIPKKIWYIILIIIIIYMILRNTNEFNFLAPTIIKK